VYTVGTLYLVTPKGALKVITSKDANKDRIVPINLPRYDKE